METRVEEVRVADGGVAASRNRKEDGWVAGSSQLATLMKPIKGLQL